MRPSIKWFPLSLTERAVWYRNFNAQIQQYGTDLGLTAGDMAAVERQTQEFNTTLFWSFLILGLGLIAAILVQVKVGLLPLRQVSKGLAKIRDGEARRLEGRFPTERHGHV